MPNYVKHSEWITVSHNFILGLERVQLEDFLNWIIALYFWVIKILQPREQMGAGKLM